MSLGHCKQTTINFYNQLVQHLLALLAKMSRCLLTLISLRVMLTCIQITGLPVGSINICFSRLKRFDLKLKTSASQWHQRKSKEVAKLIQIQPMGTMSVYNGLKINPVLLKTVQSGQK